MAGSPFDEDPHFLLAPQDVWDHLERHHPHQDGPRGRTKMITPETIAWSRAYLLTCGIDITMRELSDEEIIAVAVHELIHFTVGDDHK